MATDFGSDVSWFPDLDANLSLVTGMACLAQAIWRRLSTPRGWYAWDPEYGLDLMGLLNETIGPTTLATWQRQIAIEVEKDERVLSATARVTQTSQTSLRVSISVLTGAGPFALVLGVEDVGVSILSLAA